MARLARVVPTALALACLLSPSWAASQDGANDPTFNLADQEGLGEGANDTVFAVAVDAAGGVLIGGQFQRYNADSRLYLERLLPDGRRDLNFQGGSLFDGPVHALTLQADGKILVGGAFTQAGGQLRRGLARLNSDGTLDSSFNPLATFDAPVTSIRVQPDGKLLVGGSFQFVAGALQPGLTRLNSNGTPEFGFAPSNGPAGSIQDIALLPSGAMWVGGLFANYDGFGSANLARVQSTGEFSTLVIPAEPNGEVRALVALADGSLLIGGAFTAVGGTARSFLARLLPNGQLDTAFSPILDGAVDAISVGPDGKLVISGEFRFINFNSRPRIARLLPTGALDGSFAPGSGANARVHDFAVLANGQVMVAGAFDHYGGKSRRGIARASSSGVIDASFNNSGGADDSVRSVVAQPDGKLLLGGAFNSFNDTPFNGLVRIASDGTIDTSFSIGAGFGPLSGNSVGVVESIALDPDGKIVVVGAFASFDGTPRASVARILPNGSLDTSFNSGTGPDSDVLRVVRTPDGKYLLGGDFTSFNGFSASRIVRLNSNGSLDLTFAGSLGPNRVVRAIAIDATGKIVVGGDFSLVGGVACTRIARLLPTGALDTTFAPTGGIGGGKVLDLAIQSDGRIVAAGIFSSFNNFSRRGITRINSNGSVDISFSPQNGTLEEVRSVAILPNGKLMIAGDFDSFAGVSTDGVARLLSNGALDPSFTLRSSEGGGARAVAVLPNGRCAIGGDFDRFHGPTRHGIALLLQGTTSSYCVGKLNSAGCVPSIGTNGLPPSISSADFRVSCILALNQKSGLMFFGRRPLATPFQGGTLCVGLPTTRTTLSNSGGSLSGSNCTGTYDFAFDSATLAALSLSAGDQIFCQWWMRDPASPSTTGLSNALVVTFEP